MLEHCKTSGWLFAVAATTACATPATGTTSSPTAPGGVVFDDRFWSLWGDGRAELAGYDLIYRPYGELRHGVAVAIFVTETFSESSRVKADPGKHPTHDEFPVMKLNLVRDFPTGVYDYNMMASSFVALTPRLQHPAGSMTKISFSSQEWCGHVYHQLLFDRDGVRQTSHSYFDGEADLADVLPLPPDGISEDGLWHWARGFAEPAVAPGSSVTRPILMSLERARVRHQQLSWSEVTLSRAASTTEIPGPGGGSIRVERLDARISDGPHWTFWVEHASPQRIIKWENTMGEVANLRGSDRMKYWEMNATGSESALRRLGLRPRGEASP